MTRLLFVYNAYSGKLNTIIDVAHKIVNPKTYPCKLCALTFDTFQENKHWKNFRKTSAIQLEFYHITEFEKAYPAYSFDYPIILKDSKSKLAPILDKNQFEEVQNTQALINYLTSFLEGYQAIAAP